MSSTDSASSTKVKRSKGGTKNKSVAQLYNRMIDLVGILADLVEMQMLTDTSILQVCSGVIFDIFSSIYKKNVCFI